MATGVFKMRRWAVLSLLLCATVTACGRGDEPIKANPAYDSPVPAGPPVFIGRWAPGSAACDSGPWVIGSDGLRSPAGLACTFESIDPSSAGYIVGALCQVGKVMQPTRIVVTVTGRAPSQSITMTGGPFAEPVALSRCPSPATAAPASPPVSAAP